MPIKFYMDVHVHIAITEGLRQRGVSVITAQEDGTTRLSDSDLLNRANTLGFALFSQDEDFLVEANLRQIAGTEFVGVIYGHQQRITIGQCIADLEFSQSDIQILKTSQITSCICHYNKAFATTIPSV